MKALMYSLLVLLFTTALGGCGSGSTSAPTSTPVVTPETTRTHELIIDNGRGTINNQDTERSDTSTVTPN